MSLRREDFTCYFAELHDGHAPFAWQERLLDEVLEQGRWPAAITAPTGAGKTAVIDVHVFAQALAATGSGPTPPRRLSMVVNRRVLVDDQYVYAQTLARRLAAATGDGRPVLAAMRERLWRLAVPDPDRRAEESAGGERSPLVVARLRGGAPPSRSWRDLPTAAAVICATPEMWGSRLLFRGYGSARGAWPREAGLLACDSVLIVDEAHLARQLLCTARRVAELGAVAEQAIGASPVQVVETTATPAGAIGADSVGVEAGDLDHELLSARLSRPKPVSLRPVKDWEATKATAKAVSALAEASIEMLTGAPAAAPGEGACATVGCFVNTVARALAVASELRNRTVDGRALRVVALCGQVRPIDVDRLERHHPGLLTVAGNGEVDVLVSTQSLEVGVDLDLAGMVTELASGSALAQRAGRVNRRGLRSRAPIVVTIPEGGEVTERVRSGPYEAEELRAALDWLHLRESQPEGLAPWALRSDPPPQAGTRRMLCQRPELAQAWHWARTSDDLAAEPELELWLADEFATDTSVGLVVRDELPEDAPDAIRLLRVLPPRRHEVFSVPFGAARDALAALRAEHPLAAVVVRGDEVEALEWRPGAAPATGETPRVRPGDIVVLDSAVELFTGSETGFSPPALQPFTGGGPVQRFRADDVLEAEAELPAPVWQRRSVGGVVHRIELATAATDPAVVGLARALTSDEEPLEPEEERETLRAWLSAHADRGPMAAAASELLSQPATSAEVVIQRDTDDQPVRVLVIDRRRAAVDEDLRQVWTPAGHQITLEQHQRDVAERAASFGEALGLDDELVAMLALAGAHHDDGKQDPRFQRRLGARGETTLAKSRAGTSAEQARRNEARSGLPARWRHEQRSVLDGWAEIATAADPELVARLVGSSHGHGRSGFPLTASELLGTADGLAEELFDLGGWDELIERTQQRYGVWGCAFLEAVLRAADGQVSREGR